MNETIQRPPQPSQSAAPIVLAEPRKLKLVKERVRKENPPCTFENMSSWTDISI